MSHDNNIPPMGSPDGQRLTEDKLLAYLDGKLTPQQQYEVEQLLAEEGMESDAADGLAALSAPHRKESISRLNSRLHTRLRSKKPRRRTAKTEWNTIVALLLILILVIAGYFVIRYAL